MSKSTEGIVYAGRAILEALRSGLEVADTRQRAHLALSGLWRRPDSAPCDGDGGLDCEALWHTGAAERRLEPRVDEEVLQIGAGMAHSRVVTRCKSALTGQALGRWSRLLALDCLTCVATLKRVRMIVEGCAWAKAVWWRVCVRKA
jgi:hypothetical protein